MHLPNQVIMSVIISNIITGSSAIFSSEGLKIFQILNSSLKKTQPVEISFEGLNKVSTAFLNAAIGKLYINYPKDFLIKNLLFKDLNDTIKSKLDRTIDNAIEHEFYNDLFENA